MARRLITRRTAAPRPDRDRATLTYSMIKSVKTLCRFDGFRMLTENFPIRSFRFCEAA